VRRGLRLLHPSNCVMTEGYVAQKARIEVQNQHGEWRYYTSVTVLGPSVKHALDAALRSPLGRTSGKARALDEATGAVIDIATL